MSGKDARISPPEFRIPEKELEKYGIMPSDNQGSGGICPKSQTDSCPSGHKLTECPNGEGEGYFCEQCSERTFQPNENWAGDKCRLRRKCNKSNMIFLDHGSTTRDAKCACIEGYHFPNVDQRACFSNPICQKGFAPGDYGNCESCLEKGMYSDTVGRIKACKPLTNCEKQGRCTVVKSKGILDNLCGPKVKDLSTCEEAEHTSDGAELNRFAIGIALGAIVLLVIIVIGVFFWRRKQLRRLSRKRALTVDEVQELRLKIIKESDRDPAFCRRVLSTSSSFIVERIDRQLWTLAQELFRGHPVSGMYERIVEKYKESKADYTVRGYLQEWQAWRGETKEGVAELFRCLSQVKRDDIANEICMCLQGDVDFQPESGPKNRYPFRKLSLKEECMFAFLPFCQRRHEKKLSSSQASSDTPVVVVGVGEAGDKLLSHPTDDIDDGADENRGDNCARPPPGTFYRAHPSPSAPELEDSGVDGGHLGNFHAMGDVKFNRQFSQPVQATS